MHLLNDFLSEVGLVSPPMELAARSLPPSVVLVVVAPRLLVEGELFEQRTVALVLTPFTPENLYKRLFFLKGWRVVKD